MPRNQIPTEECSDICAIKITEDNMQAIDRTMNLLKGFPIRKVNQDGWYRFAYDYGVCDGNTAHHLEEIIGHTLEFCLIN